MDDEPKIFFDYSELNLGDSLTEQTTSSLLQSKLLLAILTPAFFKSQWCAREWATFHYKEQISDSKSPLIFPIYVRGKEMMPSWAISRRLFDMSNVPLHAPAFTDKRQSLKMTEQIQRLAKEVAQLLPKVPPFDPKWTVSKGLIS